MKTNLYLSGFSQEPMNWKSRNKLKKQLIKERGKQCADCGTDGELTIHHKNHNTNDNRKINLELLCRRCHDIRDFKKVTPNGRLANLQLTGE